MYFDIILYFFICGNIKCCDKLGYLIFNNFFYIYFRVIILFLILYFFMGGGIWEYIRCFFDFFFNYFSFIFNLVLYVWKCVMCDKFGIFMVFFFCFYVFVIKFFWFVYLLVYLCIIEGGIIVGVILFGLISFKCKCNWWFSVMMMCLRMGGFIFFCDNNYVLGFILWVIKW